MKDYIHGRVLIDGKPVKYQYFRRFGYRYEEKTDSILEVWACEVFFEDDGKIMCVSEYCKDEKLETSEKRLRGGIIKHFERGANK